MVDKHNHHLFQPMLYQVATAGLSESDIASPIRSVLRRQTNTQVLLGDVTEVRPNQREIGLGDGSILSYDYLIIAAGARHLYFGRDDWEILAPGLKSLEDADEIRRRVLLAFERAEREPDATRRHAHLTFVVVGGGATGVEVAGALAEIRSYALRRDFRRIDPREATVMLLEGGPRILPTYPPELVSAQRSNCGGSGSRCGVDVGHRGTAGLRVCCGLDHSDGNRGVGCGQCREPLTEIARRSTRSPGPSPGSTRLHRSGSSRNFCTG